MNNMKTSIGLTKYAMYSNGEQTESIPTVDVDMDYSDEYYYLNREKHRFFESDYYNNQFEELSHYVDDHEMMRLYKEWRELVDRENNNYTIHAWLRTVRDIYGPHLLGRQKCIYTWSSFLADFAFAPKSGIIWPGEDDDSMRSSCLNQCQK